MGSQRDDVVESGAVWLWAKSGADSSRFHPLICHALDTLAVAEALWERALTAAARQRLATGLRLTGRDAHAWTVGLAAAHDIGKASPPFQALWAPGHKNLVAHGFRFPVIARAVPHGVVSTVALAEELKRRGAPDEVAQALARAVGGHHGVFPTMREQNAVGPGTVGDDRWSDARTALLNAIFEAAGTTGTAPPTQADDGALARLAGLVSVADWIASDERRFPFGAGNSEPSLDQLDPSRWLARTRERAERALARLGWHVAPAPASTRSFVELFPFSPRTGQAAVERAVAGVHEPFLLVVEDLTGAGKTEASQLCLDLAINAAGARGGYVALPTRATSDQAFRRLRQFLEHAYSDQLVDLQLVHGGAQLSVDYEQLRARGHNAVEPVGVHDADGSTQLGGVQAGAWFSHRKRGLLSTFAVGTIDQALLAVLQARHFFVRLWGLADKAVILDEVHAYDAYMSELMDRLIEWLAALDTTVIVLSATLPAHRRAALVNAYRAGRGSGEIEPPNAPAYPRLTLATRERTTATGFDAQRTRELTVQWIETEKRCLTDRIAATVATGGCVAIVCNTVDSAQRRYRLLRDALPGSASDGGPMVELLTARYRHREREEREQRCLNRFGAPPDATSRPQAAVLVSTQVIEQSLDLDFDLLVSELAPVDLLIQRAGRLHRHQRRRPAGLERPEVWVLSPTLAQGAPQLDPGSAHIYAPHVLLRSWLALRDASRIREPEDIDRLIEEVYALTEPPEGLAPPLADMWRRTAAQLTDELARQRQEARLRAVQPPGAPDGITSVGSLDLAEEEDDPDLHQQLQALTRLAPPAISAVILRPAELASERHHPDGLDEARALLRHSVRISHRGVVAALRDAPTPATWTRSVLLRHHKLVELDAADRWVWKDVEIRLDPELGVVTGKGAGE